VITTSDTLLSCLNHLGVITRGQTKM
jgi:hypothetical protein